MSDIDIERKRDALNAALASRLDQWLPGVIGGGADRTGAVWKAGHVKDGGLGSSLQVDLRRSAGQWFHHPENRGGDPLGLIAYAKGCSMKEAWKIALDICGGDVPEITEADRERARRQREARDRAEAERRQRMAGNARRILFRDCQPELLNTPVEFYLAARGIDLRKLGRPLGSLYFHPALEHYGIGRRFPAMVAAIVGGDGQTIAIHRTWLVRRGNGQWDRVREKPDGGEGKLTLGSYKDAGGCIRLWAGERVDPKTGEFVKGRSWAKAEAGSAITLVEGIENGLSIVVKRPERRVAGGVALAGLASVQLPAAFTKVYIAGDNDPANPHALQGFANAIEAHRSAGRDVFDLRPPADFKDWNDMLLGKRRKVAA